ncbi:MAG: hypothetical protein SFT90_07440 [Rickettsiales bacterium]|nr:hypothetical protein [Rickettsiales bacterium]
MSDIDNYLLKCTLEKLEENKDSIKATPEKILEECSCKYGIKD